MYVYMVGDSLYPSWSSFCGGIVLAAASTQPLHDLQIHKYKYTHTSTQIQVHKYKYVNTNTQLPVLLLRRNHPRSHLPPTPTPWFGLSLCHTAGPQHVECASVDCWPNIGTKLKNILPHCWNHLGSLWICCHNQPVGQLAKYFNITSNIGQMSNIGQIFSCANVQLSKFYCRGGGASDLGDRWAIGRMFTLGSRRPGNH